MRVSGGVRAALNGMDRGRAECPVCGHMVRVVGGVFVRHEVVPLGGVKRVCAGGGLA